MWFLITRLLFLRNITKVMLLPIMIFIFLFAIDLYVYKGISLLINNTTVLFKRFIKIPYWIFSLVITFQFIFIVTRLQNYRSLNPELFRVWSAIFFTIFITKLVFIIFHLLDDIVTLIKRFFLQKKYNIDSKSQISRSKFLTQIGLITSSFFLGIFTYGIFKGRYNFKVFKEKISFSNLPDSFNGFRIVQISDLHLGSFVKDFNKIDIAIEMVNNLKPDLILFTGDMVNVHSDEAEPWIDTFSRLKAKYGKYSVFGNHDYGDYGRFSDEEKLKSIKRLKNIHSEMGFKLLEDEHDYIEINNQKIAIIGMHNWGKDFHRVGDLDKSLEGLKKADFKLLLSHDPTLWEEKIKDKKNIDLTLSGHTHGMQMGVEIKSLGIKWSPVSLRYKKWAGLYRHGNNCLYINRGLGFIGYPGRVGIKPEITFIELVSTV